MNNQSTQQNTQHKADCRMAFGRKDPSCPRCQELLNGASPRLGWGARNVIINGKLQMVSGQKAAEIESANRSREISRHYENHEQNCDYARRGVPCVAFDW